MDFTTPSSRGSGSYRNAPRVRRTSGAQMANVPSSHRDTIPGQAGTLHRSPPDAGDYHTDGRRQPNSSQYTGEYVSFHQYAGDDLSHQYSQPHYQPVPRSWAAQNPGIPHVLNNPNLQDAIDRLSQQNTHTQALSSSQNLHSTPNHRHSSYNQPAVQHSQNTWPLGYSNLQYLNEHHPQLHRMDRRLHESQHTGPYDAAGYVSWQSDYERPLESRSDQRYAEYDHMSNEGYEVDEEQQDDGRSSATFY